MNKIPGSHVNSAPKEKSGPTKSEPGTWLARILASAGPLTNSQGGYKAITTDVTNMSGWYFSIYINALI